MMLNSTKKTHFKMYKSGKRWLVAGITVVGFGAAFGVTAPAKADTTGDANANSAQPTNSQAANSAQTNLQAKQVPLKTASAASQTAVSAINGSRDTSTTPSQANSAAKAAPATVTKTPTVLKTTTAKSTAVASAAVAPKQTTTTTSAASQATSQQAKSATATLTTNTKVSSATQPKAVSATSVQSNVSVKSSAPKAIHAAQADQQQATTAQTVSTQSSVKNTSAAKKVNIIKLAPDANDADLAAAKAAAKANFAQTGQAQQIVRVGATFVDNGNIYTDDGLIYKVNADGISATLSGFSGNTPPTLNYDGTDTLKVPNGATYKITAIKDEAFMNDTLTGTYVVPDTVESIGENAFHNNQLTIKLNSGVKSIGADAFSAMENDPNTKTNTLGSVDLSQLNSLGKNAFKFAGLTNVSMAGASITEIPTSAFENNPSLSDVTLPSGLQKIDDSAFANQYSGDPSEKTSQLTTIAIPDSVTTIDSRAFFADNLSSIKLLPSSSLQTIGDLAFGVNNLTGQLQIPDTVTSIGIQAFNGNSINKLTLSKQLTTIGGGAFANNQIDSLSLPDKLTTVAAAAFENNKISGNLDVPSSITSIGAAAFEANTIGNLTLHSGLETIDENAFNQAGVTNQNLQVPDSVKTIGDQAFFSNNIQSLQFSKTQSQLTTLGTAAFAENQIGNTIDLPDSLTAIPAGAFSSNSLTYITIPVTVKTIGKDAFTHNYLASISLPTGIDYGGNNDAFNEQSTSYVLLPNADILDINHIGFAATVGAYDKYDITEAPYRLDKDGTTHIPATDVKYDSSNSSFTVDIKDGVVKPFYFGYKDISHPETGIAGTHMVVYDYTGIHLAAAKDAAKTPNTYNMPVKSDYNILDSIDHYTKINNTDVPLADLIQVKYDDIKNGTVKIDPSKNYLVIEDSPQAKTINTQKPGKYQIILTTNGFAAPTEGPNNTVIDNFQVTGNVNVNQTYTWKFVDQDGKDLTGAVDPTTGKDAITTLDVPAENYTVALPATLTANDTTYYLMATPFSDDATIAWTKPIATFKYTTDSATITGKSHAAVKVGTTWDTAAEASVLASVTEPNGTVMTAAQIKQALDDGTITVDATVDTTKVGEPTPVTFTYHYDNQQAKTTVNVNVTQAPILNAKNVSVFLNDKKDDTGAPYETTYPVYDSKDEYGYDLDSEGTILVNGQPVSDLDTSKAGPQTFIYTYQDAANLFDPVHATATVTVVDDTAVTAPSTYYVKKGTTFEPQQIITRLTSPQNVETKTAAEVKAALDSGALKITGTVDSSKTGSTPLKYSYTDGGKTVTGTTDVIVVADPLINLNADVTIGLGNIFKSSSLFRNGTDENDQPLTLKQVHVTSDVNENKEATYPVTLSYDYQQPTNSGTLAMKRSIAIGHVTVADKTHVQAVPSVTITSNDNFDPSSLVASATRADDTNLTISELKQAFSDGELLIIGQYDLKTAGQYPVSVGFKDHEYDFSPSVINVTEQPKILVHSPLTFSLNSDYGVNGEEASLESADDEYGNKLALDKLTVDQQVNTKVAGQYNVVFTYQDAAHIFKPATATAVVIVNDKTAITSQAATTTLTQGQQFDPYTLVKDVINTDGNKLTDAQVAAAIKDGTLVAEGLDTSKLGAASVTFTYSDGGKKATSTSNVDVTVPTKLNVKSAITVNMNTSYDPSMSYLGGADQYGHAVPLSAVAVTNLPDINTAGTYHVTFHYLDATTTADVTVKDASSMVVVPTITVQKGTAFDPLSAITSITKPNGAPMSRAELEAAYNGKKILTVTGVANTNVVGTYGIDYSYDDPILGHTDVRVVNTSTPQPASQGSNAGSETPGSTPQSVASQTSLSGENSVASQAQSQNSLANNSQASQRNSQTNSSATSVASQAQSQNSQANNSQASQSNSQTNGSASSVASQNQSQNSQANNSQASQSNSQTNSSASSVASQAQSQNSQANNSQASQSNSQTNSSATSVASQAQSQNSLANNSQAVSEASQTSQGNSLASNAPDSQTPSQSGNSVAASQASGQASQSAKLQPTDVDQPTNPQKQTTTTAADDVVTTAPAKTAATVHLTKPTARQTAATKLPQTNEQDTSALVMAMLGMSLLLSAYFIGDHKRFDK